MHVRKPALIKGAWSVIVSDTTSPISEVIDTFSFGSREKAWQGYVRIKRDVEAIREGDSYEKF